MNIEDEVSEGKGTQIEEIAGFRGDMRTPRKTKILSSSRCWAIAAPSLFR
jgi:hypothetical protein